MAKSDLQDGLYTLDTSSRTLFFAKSYMVMFVDRNLWHRHLAHVHEHGICNMIRSRGVDRTLPDTRQKLGTCYGCLYAMSTKVLIHQKARLVSRKSLNECIRLFGVRCMSILLVALGNFRCSSTTALSTTG